MPIFDLWIQSFLVGNARPIIGNFCTVREHIKLPFPGRNNKEVSMTLKEYFESTKGLGILSTADGDGRVDAAIYSRPHFMEDGTLALVMRDRLSHANLQSNPHAMYLFKEDGPGYNGKRLFLTKVKEEKNTELLESLRRRKEVYQDDADRFLVFFQLEKEVPLVGDGSKAS